MQEGISKRILQGMFLNSRKKAAIAVDMGNDMVRNYAKGAPDFLIKNCTLIQFGGEEFADIDDFVTEEQYANLKAYDPEM
jgi:hypothetical protein